ncbi:MAG TPA: lipoyl(octanoyl) transferase LipB [Turneriella sp.]|nr:lipoyl(octanoyl) transferase LipB [Turneriella sp.]
MQSTYAYWGLTPYPDAIARLEEHFEKALATPHAFVFGLEHPLVYTAGLRTEKNHIVNPNIEIQTARRGGSVTLHNPGQLVVYFAMSFHETPGLETLVRLLEGAIIETLWSYGVQAFIEPPHSGVFTQHGKIGFIGLGLKKQVVYHGIAININNNLSDYQAIHSCGLTLPVTRLKDLIKEEIPLEEFGAKLFQKLENRFSMFDQVVYKTQASVSIDELPFPFAAFRLGQLFFNERRFWLAHETWEHIWQDYRAVYGKENKTEYIMFFHGLIQLAMAAYRAFEVVRVAGAESLLGKSLEKLPQNRYFPIYVKNHTDVLRWMHAAHDGLKKGNIPPFPPPILTF